MQRRFVVIPEGPNVRYTLLVRPGGETFYVRFVGPDGSREMTSTGRTREPDAGERAHQIIREKFNATVATSETVPWEVAEARLAKAMEAENCSSVTVCGYLGTLRQLKTLFPMAKGPADVTDRMASDFRERYGQTAFTRKRKLKEGEIVPTYQRKAKSSQTRIRSLKAIFGRFAKMKLVAANPFAEISLPKVDREVKYVSTDDINNFWAWVEDQYGDWEFPQLFFGLKGEAACRLNDLCSILSSDVRDGGVYFIAENQKTAHGRFQYLDPEFYRRLRAYAGATYLWEKYPAELKARIVTQGKPSHRLNPEFSTTRLSMWVVQRMQDYQRASGRDLTSHDFRRATLTRAAEANIHPKEASAGFGVSVETMFKYYTAVDQRKANEAVSKRLKELRNK